MAAAVRGPFLALALAAGALGTFTGPVAAQSSNRDGIADLMKKSANGPKVAQTTVKPAALWRYCGHGRVGRGLFRPLAVSPGGL